MSRPQQDPTNGKPENHKDERVEKDGKDDEPAARTAHAASGRCDPYASFGSYGGVRTDYCRERREADWEELCDDYEEAYGDAFKDPARLETLSLEVPKELVDECRAIYEREGLGLECAVHLFLRQTVLVGALPFKLRFCQPECCCEGDDCCGEDCCSCGDCAECEPCASDCGTLKKTGPSSPS